MPLVESPTGFEPVYSAWQADALTRLSYEDISILYSKMERRADPETAYPAWKAGILPLN